MKSDQCNQSSSPTDNSNPIAPSTATASAPPPTLAYPGPVGVSGPPRPAHNPLGSRRQSSNVFTSISLSAHDDELWSGRLATASHTGPTHASNPETDANSPSVTSPHPPSPRTPTLERPSTDPSRQPDLNSETSLAHQPTDPHGLSAEQNTPKAAVFPLSNAQSPPTSSSKGWSAVKAKLITGSLSAGQLNHNAPHRKRSESAGLPSGVTSFLRPKKAAEVKNEIGGAELTTELRSGFLPVSVHEILSSALIPFADSLSADLICFCSSSRIYGVLDQHHVKDGYGSR